MRWDRLCIAALAANFAIAAATGAAPRVVAAENFYGEVAAEIAGPGVPVSSILSNPNTDPHEFELSPSVARQVAAASIVAYNGAGYDPWMTRLLAASPATERAAIEAAALVGAKPGDNPHLWYDPRTMPAMARALAAVLERQDPADGRGFRQRLSVFLASLAPLDAKISAIRAKWAGTPVMATEPVFGDMAAALGLRMHNQRFQVAVMNGTEPRPSDIAAFEADLRGHRVRVLFYNAQVSDNLVQHMRNLAQASRVAVVGVTETMPPGASYAGWMLRQLDTLDRVLAAGE